jgi:hypothetical protein
MTYCIGIAYSCIFGIALAIGQIIQYKNKKHSKGIK